MAEMVEALGLPKILPSQSRTSRFQFFGPIWFPKVKFEVEYELVRAPPLSGEALKLSEDVFDRWMVEPPIGRKCQEVEIPRKRRHAEI
jgi:hypothetical protein